MSKLSDITTHFQKADPLLFAVLQHIELSLLVHSENYFADLCDSIVSQQLSLKAGNTIFNRFKDLMPDKKITPANILDLTLEELRKTGMSNAKCVYIKDLASKVENKEVQLQHFTEMDNETVITKLTKIKGIGRWTAEMFLMFTLAREDVFSAGDIGLQNGIKKVYGLDEKPSKEYMEELSKKWSPYRTYASRILWKSLEIL